MPSRLFCRGTDLPSCHSPTCLSSMSPRHRRTGKTITTTPTFQTSCLIPLRPCPPSLTCHVPPRLPCFRTRAYPHVTRCGIQRPERYDATDWAKALSTLPRSIVLRRVRGHIIANSVASSLVLVAYEFLLRNAPDFVHHLNVTPIPHTFMVNAMSLLLVFRSNAAYTAGPILGGPQTVGQLT
ncbi:unnamed protein product [Chondrus crispus]|uniref:Uncharacterized protein n=1 Tax=Chondrus crispus TaxID=2769 RepID=R7QNZ2_CHOCR|nr:unnamed protein product [Chondrus crispus]CDF39206.1 unnamed protein product [Chondrus crispus]|eukprot:XP_005719117.1 unnamed protein product [Chondrus crispus]